GTDQTRNGHFATSEAFRSGPSVNPSIRDPSKVRGADNGGTSLGIPTGGPATEPLPSILPLQSRLGLRLHSRRIGLQVQRPPTWNIELATRLVAAQNRVAASLLETPTAGFAIVDINAYWQRSPNTLFKLGLENLGN